VLWQQHANHQGISVLIMPLALASLWQAGAARRWVDAPLLCTAAWGQLIGATVCLCEADTFILGTGGVVCILEQLQDCCHVLGCCELFVATGKVCAEAFKDALTSCLCAGRGSPTVHHPHGCRWDSKRKI
jgi:hypothetical protein